VFRPKGAQTARPSEGSICGVINTNHGSDVQGVHILTVYCDFRETASPAGAKLHRSLRGAGRRIFGIRIFTFAGRTNTQKLCDATPCRSASKCLVPFGNVDGVMYQGDNYRER
jgi:hypothetical protein